MDIIEMDPERREAEKRKLQNEIDVLKKSLGVGFTPHNKLGKDENDDLSSAEEKPSKKKSKKEKAEDKELKYLKMQQENLEKEIEKLKESKKYDEYGEEESEDLEFDDEEEEGNIQESAVIAKKKTYDNIDDNYPTSEQVNDHLEDYDQEKSRVTFGYNNSKKEEDKSLLKATMFRAPNDPSKYEDKRIAPIPKRNVFKKSEIVEEEDESDIMESQILERKVTETDENDPWKF